MKIKDRLHCGPVSVRRSAIHGYGVFADQPIHKGDLVEECHVVFAEERPLCLYNHLFTKEGVTVMPLGLGAIYNHSDDFNVDFSFDLSLSLLCFTATKDIQADEELCINYGRGWFTCRKFDLISPLKYRYRHLYQLLCKLWRFGLVVGAFTSAIYFSSILLGK